MTDASKLGWHAVLGAFSTNGSFPSKEMELHINVLKLKATYFGLQNSCGNVSCTHLKVPTDKVLAVHSINNMGSCKSLSCDSEVRIFGFGLLPEIILTVSLHCLVLER